LYRFDGRGFTQVIPQVSISRILEASNGHLLLVSSEGFMEWDGAHVVRRPDLVTELGVRGDVFHAFQDHSGATWFCTSKGVFRVTADSTEQLKLPPGTSEMPAFLGYEDGRGNLWVTMEAGIFRARAHTLEPFAPGVSGRTLFADRDGNLWAGTNGAGLIRFKDRAVRMFTKADGLPTDVVMTVLATHDGKLWVGNNCGGLSWFDGRSFHTYNESQGLTNSCVYALAEDGNHDLWVGGGGGVFRFHDGRFTGYTTADGLATDQVRSILAARDGSLWMGTRGGVSRMREGRFRTYTTADGLSSSDVINTYQDRDGTIWAGTVRGINRLDGDRFVPIPSQDARLTIIAGEDSLGGLYVAAPRLGVSRLEGGQLGRFDAAIGATSMIAWQQNLWFGGGRGVLRVAANSLRRWQREPDDPLDYAAFARADGFSSAEGSAGFPNLTVTPDGKLWVATVQGLAMLDLPRLPRAAEKPATYIGEITVDRKTEPPGRGLVLLPGMHHVELRFDSIELSSPERTRLQYRLDGVDAAWFDAGAIHSAVYTNIPVGTHRFHVRASNRDGIWDRSGIVYSITQQPYFYETASFRLAAVVAGFLLLAGVYRVRLRQAAARLNARLEERIAERERIARELHDTLLQGFQGLILRFQAAANRIPNSEPARHMMDETLDRADEVMAQGRDRVKNLRTSPEKSSDLAQSFVCAGEEISRGSAVEVSVIVEGDARSLHPAVLDEAYWIGREALVNAVIHSSGRRVEVEIAYDPRELRVRFRDDGRGIDPQILESGRPGHWGLAGMRERAQKMGARFSIGSRPGAGTEIELRVPALVAYRGGAVGPPWGWLRRVAIGGR
jgi:signal transduction histidine kinase/streptogramin lyase